MDVITRGENIGFVAEFNNEDFLVENTQTVTLSIQSGSDVWHHPMDELVIVPEDNMIYYMLTQEDTLALHPYQNALFELNLLTNDQRHCTVKLMAGVVDTLFNEPLEV